MGPISHNVETILARIQEAAKKSGRDETMVCPIVVTKNRTNDEIQEVYSLGFRHFAENRVEKLLERQAAFPQEDIVWHLIGPLQKRKVKDVINKIDYFHALDRLSIMTELDKRLEHRLDCFLEVNVSGEATKHGFAPNEVANAMTVAATYKQLHVVGLMTMAPVDATDAELHQYFGALRQLAQQLETETPLQLSMGMSHDYCVAIEEGATFVRIGTAWFEEEE